MDEAGARAWLASECDVPRETFDRLDAFVALLRAENERQNLVSAASLDHVWTRHIVDSAQLLRFGGEGAWLDLGTGAGFPGLIVSALRDGPVTMVEERKRRIDFLERAADVLGIADRATIVCGRVEKVKLPKYAVISARAFAPLERLLDWAERFATPETRWVLPKGRNAKSELEAVRSSWQGDFRVEPSLTDEDAGIIVAQGVRRRAKGDDSR